MYRCCPNASASLPLSAWLPQRVPQQQITKRFIAGIATYNVLTYDTCVMPASTIQQFQSIFCMKPWTKGAGFENFIHILIYLSLIQDDAFCPKSHRDSKFILSPALVNLVSNRFTIVVAELIGDCGEMLAGVTQTCSAHAYTSTTIYANFTGVCIYILPNKRKKKIRRIK